MAIPMAKHISMHMAAGSVGIAAKKEIELKTLDSDGVAATSTSGALRQKALVQYQRQTATNDLLAAQRSLQITTSLKTNHFRTIINSHDDVEKDDLCMEVE